ncbi:hypothetical protein P2318_34790 [Myxococcaceae bacterium GXIMD 01537]
MRSKFAGWCVVASLLAGCPGPDEPAGPNGKQGVLFFVPNESGVPEDAQMVAHGLDGDVLIPARLTSFRGTHHREFDFDGTTLEVEADAGVTVVEARRWGRSYRFTYRCDASSESRAEREVRVRVRAADGAERYADAYTVSCARGGRLLASDTSAWSSARPARDGHVRYLLGTEVRFYPTLDADWDVAPPGVPTTSLKGRGAFTLDDPQGVLRPLQQASTLELGKPLAFEVVGVGSGARLRLAGLETELRVEGVAPADVRFVISADFGSAQNGWEVRARGELLSEPGAEVGLGPCVLEVRPTLGEPTTHQDICSTYIPASATHGTVCATFRGQQACTEFRR